MKKILTILLAFMSLHVSAQNMLTEPSVTRFGDSYMLTLPLVLHDVYNPAIVKDSKLVINFSNGLNMTINAVDTCDIPEVYMSDPTCYVYYPQYPLTKYQLEFIKANKVVAMFRYVGFQERPLYKTTKRFNAYVRHVR